MKKFSPILAKGKASSLRLLLAIFLFSMPVMTGNIYASPIDDPVTTTAPADTYCGVTEPEIVKYLAERGFEVYALEHEPGTCNAIATTQCEYRIRVIISEGQIIAAEDF